MATKTENKNKYYEAVGRRKNAVARVRIFPASKTAFTINDRELSDIFPTEALQATVREAFEGIETKDNFEVTVKVNGGGISSQAESIRLGIARALLKYDAELRPDLKHKGYLKRDPRVKERKKFGKKKARKSPQWSKR